MKKLARTYFRQLIDGLEYLHSQGVRHLDLKLENLLIGDDYQLKIIDFDLSYMSGDTQILTRGSKFYRAPELRASQCRKRSSSRYLLSWYYPIRFKKWWNHSIP